MQNANKLIKAKNSLESNILKLLRNFENETTLRVTSIDIDRMNFSYSIVSEISAVHLEVKLP